MTELELYRYINDNYIEWHYHDNDGVEDVLIFPFIFQMDVFAKLVSSATDDEGIECRLKDGYFCIWMRDICEYYGIEMNNVFKKEEE